MKRFLLIAALTLSLGGAAVVAQQVEHAKRAHDPHKMAMKMGKKLGLSQDQTAKMAPVLAARQQKIMAVR